MAYRDDRTALEAKRAELLEERAEVRRRLDAVASDVERERRIDREVEAIERKLSRSAEAQRRVLEDVRVASPCGEDWEKMTGDARVRFCARCEKNVYNLSAMTRAEAEAVLAENESPCVRLYKRADGTVITNDCPVGASKKRRRLKVLSAVGAAAASAGAFAWWATRPSVDRMGVQVMGEMAQVQLATPPVAPDPTDTTQVVMGAPPPQHVQGKISANFFATPPQAPVAQPPSRMLTRRPGTPTSR